MNKALKTVRLKKFRYTVLESHEGDILHIDRFGNIQRSKFTPKEEDWHSLRFFSSSLYGWENTPAENAELHNSYAALIELCGYFGVDEEDVMYLYEMGYSISEIEEFVMNPHLLDDIYCEGF